MAMWKHFVVLFGGFYDPGVKSEYANVLSPRPLTRSAAHYLNDTWLFDTTEYKWQQLEFGPNDRAPSYAPFPSHRRQGR